MRYTLDDLLQLTEKEIKDIEQNVLDKDKIDKVELLLMVVNSSEYHAAMHYLSKSKVEIISENGHPYYIGKWGKLSASLICQTDSGSFGDGESYNLTRLSIDLFPNLKFIVALGVCGTFGKIGDVIVSNKICGCNKLKIKGDNNNFDIINRDDITEAGSHILSILKANYRQWYFVCTKPECNKQYRSKAVFKPMLSGTPLIADEAYRDKLKEGVRSEAGGLEMEGIGVLKAIKEAKKRDKIDFVIVKAGCDYADKSKNKQWQPVAAMAASDFLYKQLNKQLLMGMSCRHVQI